MGRLGAAIGELPVVTVGDLLIDRLREFERIGVHHLRLGFDAPDATGQLALMQQVAEKILPALR